MRSRGFGYIPNRPSGKIRKFAANLDQAIPPAHSLEAFAPAPYDQGATGSCTAHAVIGAILTTAEALGAPLRFSPSARVLYTLTRCLDRRRRPNGELPPLEDDGAEPGQTQLAIREWGVVPSPCEGSDVTPQNVNDELDLDEVIRASHALLSGDYAIEGPSLERRVMLALSRGQAVSVGFYADTAFIQYRGKGALGTPNFGSDGGWHYCYLIGYERDSFRLRNSWGSDWGDGGDADVSFDFLRACEAVYASAVHEIAV